MDTTILTRKICISHKHDQFNGKDIKHETKILNRIDTFRNSDQFCDVVLIAENDDKRINAHRLILAASSDYFSTLLQENSEANEISLKHINGEILEILVHYCYTGNLLVSGETIAMIIEGAEMMRMHSAVETCCSFLIHDIQTHNCIKFMLFALKMNLITLFDACEGYICKHFEEMSNTTDFLQLQAPHLAEIIARDDVVVSSEVVVFNAVKKWLEYNPEIRNGHIDYILANVRLPLLSPAFLADNVEPICTSVKSKSLITEALKYHLLPGRKCLLTNVNARPRIGYYRLIAVYQHEGCVQVTEFNKTTSSWSEWFSISISKCQFGITTMNGRIMFSGGYNYNNRSQTKEVSCYDWVTKQLKSLHSMISSRSGHAMIAHNGLLYVMGGKTESGQYLGTVEKFNTVSGRWVSCTSMRKARCDAGIGVIDNRIYIVGGYQSQKLKSVEYFRTDTEIWHSSASLIRPRSNPGVAVVNGLLYAFGGCANESSFECYDPSTNKWTLYDANNLLAPRTSCAVIDNFIYVSSDSISIKKYDTNLKIFHKVPLYKNIPKNGSIALLVLPYVDSVKSDAAKLT